MRQNFCSVEASPLQVIYANEEQLNCFLLESKQKAPETQAEKRQSCTCVNEQKTPSCLGRPHNLENGSKLSLQTGLEGHTPVCALGGLTCSFLTETGMLLFNFKRVNDIFADTFKGVGEVASHYYLSKHPSYH